MDDQVAAQYGGGEFTSRNKFTAWVYTFNYGGRKPDGTLQPVRDAVDRFTEYVGTKADYHVAGFESAPTTGQLHLQGYFQLGNRARISELKRWPEATTVHFQPARADHEANRVYCLGLKPPKQPAVEFIEEGEARELEPAKAEKKRWADALDTIKRGKFEELDPQIQICHGKACDYLIDKYRPEPVDLPPGDHRNIWVWGPTGTGKSREARVFLRREYPGGFYTKLHNKWYDHYVDGQPVLIDDLGLDVGKCLRDYLKSWGDMYVFNGERKGGVRTYRPPILYVTSNYHPWEIFGGTKDYEPIMRRFNVVFRGNPGDVEPQMGPDLIVFPEGADPRSIPAPPTNVVDLTEDTAHAISDLCAAINRAEALVAAPSV